MKNPNFGLLVLFLLHVLVPRYSSANPTAPTDNASLTESDINEVMQVDFTGNSSSPAEHYHDKVMQAALSGNLSSLTENDAMEITEAVLLAVLSGKDLSQKENYTIVQFQQKIQAILSGNFSSLTKNDKTEAMEAVMKTVLSDNFSTPTENDLKRVIQEVLSGNHSSSTENDIISLFRQKIQVVWTGNLSSLTENDATEVKEAVLQALLTGKISSPTENNAMFQVKQKVQTVLSGNFSILTEIYVKEVIEAILEEKLSSNVSSPAETDVSEEIEAVLEEKLSRNVLIPTENDGKDLMPAASSFSDSSPIISGYVEGADLMTKMVYLLIGKVKGTEFDEIVTNLEFHISTLPAKLSDNRAPILASLYKARNYVKRTKNIMMIAANKLQSNCKDLIALFARKDTENSLMFIKYTAKKFVRFVTSTKEILEEADNEMKDLHLEISKCEGLIKDLFSTLKVAEKDALINIETRSQEFEIKLDDLNHQKRKLQENAIANKGRSNNIILDLVLFFFTGEKYNVFGDSNKVITNALEHSKADELEIKITKIRIELNGLQSKLDRLNGTVISIRNSNLAAEEVVKTVNEITFSVNNEISLMNNWTNTMTETMNNFKANKIIDSEVKEAIINRLNVLLKACNMYMGNEIASFLSSK